MGGMEDGMAHFAGFVLCDFVLGVLLAVPALAVGAASLWYVHLLYESDQQLVYGYPSLMMVGTKEAAVVSTPHHNPSESVTNDFFPSVLP